MATAPQVGTFSFSEGCQFVPSSGTVGKGVFAWSTYQYSTNWRWFGWLGDPAHYTWSIQTSGGATYTWGTAYDANNWNINVPANIYHWGAQNHHDKAQQWYVCWHDN